MRSWTPAWSWPTLGWRTASGWSARSSGRALWWAPAPGSETSRSATTPWSVPTANCPTAPRCPATRSCPTARPGSLPDGHRRKYAGLARVAVDVDRTAGGHRQGAQPFDERPRLPRGELGSCASHGHEPPATRPVGQHLDDRLVRGRTRVVDQGRGCVDRLWEAIGRVVRVAPDRHPYRVRGAPAEQIRVGRSYECGRPGAVLARQQHPVGQPAYDGDRHALDLALDQIRSTGDLVDDRRSGDREPVAVPVGGVGKSLERVQARGPDGDVGLPLTPGPAGRVGDDDGDVDPGQPADPLPQLSGRGVRVVGEHDDRPGRGVRRVETGRRQSQAVAGPDDPGRAAPGDHSYGMPGDELVAVALVDEPGGLAHDLARDDDGVAVGQPAQRRHLDQRRQVVARPDLGEAADRDDLHAIGHARSSSTKSKVATAIASVAAGSRINSGTARAAMPADSIRGTNSASASWTSQPSR